MIAIGWLRTTEMYQKLRITVLTGLSPSGDSEGHAVPQVSPGFWWLLAILGARRLVGASPQYLPLLSHRLCCVSASSFRSLIRTCPWDLGATAIQWGHICVLASSASAKTLFPRRSYSEILGGHDSWEDTM